MPERDTGAYFACVVTGIFVLLCVLLSQTGAEAALESRTIIIDAGHGGEDGGAVSVTGTKESEINLETAKRLDAFFGLFAAKTLMLRTEDSSMCQGSFSKSGDLRRRVEIVNAEKNALLVSIHQNYFPEERYSGAQVFYSDFGGSRELAQELQDTLRRGLNPDNRREIKPAGEVYIMEHTSCTAVLVECGFISNDAEARRLEDEVYQKRLALCIGAAVLQNIDGEPVG